MPIHSPSSLTKNVPIAKQQPSNYSPYGYQNIERGTIGQWGFNGELFSNLTGCYALGRGHRLYNPRLMRFIRPDVLSPFHRGGLNCYAYCLNDPVNALDPSGKASFKSIGMAVKAAMRLKNNLASWPLAPSEWKTLFNRGEKDLQTELATTANLIKMNTTTIYSVTGPESLSKLSNEQFKHKFILTRDKQFLIASFTGEDPSHASLTAYSHFNIPASRNVVSAGYLYQEGNNLSLDNRSGHYLPSLQQLTPAVDRLNELGITVTNLRTGPIPIGYVANFTDLHTS